MDGTLSDANTPEAEPEEEGFWTHGKCCLGTVVAGLAIALLTSVGVMWFARYGMSRITAEVQDQLSREPVVVEELGELQSLELRWRQSVTDEAAGFWIYDAAGTRSDGVVRARIRTNPAGEQEILEATLTLPDGRVVELR